MCIFRAKNFLHSAYFTGITHRTIAYFASTSLTEHTSSFITGFRHDGSYKVFFITLRTHFNKKHDKDNNMAYGFFRYGFSRIKRISRSTRDDISAEDRLISPKYISECIFWGNLKPIISQISPKSQFLRYNMCQPLKGNTKIIHPTFKLFYHHFPIWIVAGHRIVLTPTVSSNNYIPLTCFSSLRMASATSGTLSMPLAAALRYHLSASASSFSTP